MIYYEAKDFPVDGLEATGDDVKVHVPKGAEWRSYNLFGDQDGSIIVDGAGVGNAYRVGDGKGDAYRYGKGAGGAWRYGEGHAWRWGAGNGGAYRDGEIEEDE
jgi:hypothetical protein